MPSRSRPQQWCPSELSAAAAPLRLTGALLEAVADDHRGLERLTRSEPDVHAAMQRFLDRWELPLWGLGQEALDLATALETSVVAYTALEEAVRAGFLDHVRLATDGCP